MTTKRRCRSRRIVTSGVTLLTLMTTACGSNRPVAIGPIPAPDRAAQSVGEATRLTETARIEFRWELNEAGSRVDGIGIARVEPPFRARLDLFLDNGEGVVSAALVEDELRLPYGAPDDVLPPVELMWATLGVFRPLASARLAGGEKLEGGARRFRYAGLDDLALHYEVANDRVQALEMLEGSSVVQWVRLTAADDGMYPAEATYRNLVDFRELKITRTAVISAQSFDPSIWDPRAQ
ncbi:MAG: hypothetical protein P8L45_07905 [Longimicrobiales bacterium]|nr:hypothetical protein [Longimicrobiales bacterium]